MKRLERLLNIDSNYAPDTKGRLDKFHNLKQARSNRPGVVIDGKNIIKLYGDSMDFPNVPKVKMSESFKSIEKNPENHKVDRVGIIPYSIFEGELYFALGIDYVYRELTDMGGTRNIDKHPVVEAYKEIVEESCGIFRDLDFGKLVNDSPVLHNMHSMVMFYPLNDEEKQKYGLPFKLQLKYKIEECERKKHPEILSTFWVKGTDLLKLVTEKSFYGAKKSETTEMGYSNVKFNDLYKYHFKFFKNQQDDECSGEYFKRTKAPLNHVYPRLYKRLSWLLRELLDEETYETLRVLATRYS